MQFQKLKQFITTDMRMAQVYQPVMLIELLENNGEATISGNHRLRATSEIDDREAAVAQKNTGIRFFKITLRIRPTVRETASHALQIRAVARAEKSGYAAHQTEPVCPSQFRVLLTR